MNKQGKVEKSKKSIFTRLISFEISFQKTSASLRLCVLIFLFSIALHAQNKYEDRVISKIDITFAETGRERSATDQYMTILRGALGDKYSAVKVREALQKLYDSGRIVSASVEATENGADGVNLRFVIKRKTIAERVIIQIGTMVGDPVTEQELLLRLNFLSAGTPITEQTLRNNADLILEYLRDRGYFKADVKYTQTPLTDQTRVAVTFQVNPNAQAKVENFNINILGFDPAKVRQKLALKSGEFFSRQTLEKDIVKIREALREEKFIAPELEEPRVVYDGEKNTINIDINGKVGATVNITVDAGEDVKVGDKTQTKLLSIKREGTLDYSAIIEGARRLRNYFQEQGYFFAEVTAVCSVKPDFTENEASEVVNDTESLCSALSGAELMNRVVEVKYKANLNRKLKLVDIRIEGTDEFKVEDIQSVLESQEANILGFIPYFGYGRGYTSTELIEDDRRTLQNLMRELGYRQAKVTVRQGVSLTGDDLILTFVIEEGIPTRIDNVSITGNKAFDEATLLAKLPTLIGKNFSRARARNGVKELAAFYSREGFYDAKVTYSIVELDEGPNALEERVKIVYNIENEGRKVFVNRIMINGNERTKRDAILTAITLRRGQVLRAADIFTSEQNLYASDAFGLVDIKTEPAGENANGDRLSDIIINVEEKAPRLITYGGGFSTDGGVNGFFDIRHFNLFGKLQQGGAQIRVSSVKQLAQIDFINPRFMQDGKNKDGIIRYAPLTFRAMYQRDSTVTRFFRSTFDKGTLGVVQRVDEDGNPIDEFGNDTGTPTINRLSVSLETSRTISSKYRSIAFLRYRYEDVRLFNIESLLIRDLLRPDSKVRISGFGVNFALDTRENCNIKYTILDIIAKGEPGNPCRYSPSDPTKGTYLTAEYNVSIPFLGANVGFHKFQASFYKFYTFPKLKNMTLAGRAIIGLASVFKRNQNFSSSQFPDLEGILPISERFFAGGSTSLRGFEFESAGPRVVVVPQGIFRNSNGDPVFLDPFTIPFGGNGLAIVNLEARIPVTKSVRVVPFYDGGNVFRRVGDIFNPPDIPANDVFRQNLRALWTHTVGLGLRLKTPVGGEFAVDYGFLLNPPRFLIPQQNAPNAIFQLRKEQLHFRFAQAF
jgi:outer membrane protein insertion porin family